MAATDSVRVKQELVDSSFCAPMGKRGEPDEWITSDCPEEEETMAARSVSISIKEEPRDTTFSILPGSQDSNNSSVAAATDMNVLPIKEEPRDSLDVEPSSPSSSNAGLTASNNPAPPSVNDNLGQTKCESAESELLQEQAQEGDSPERGRKLKCHACSTTFFSDFDRDAHPKSYVGEVHACDACRPRASFSESRPMQRAGEILHRCEQCSCIFVNKTSLERHTVVHYTERTFKCNLCSATLFCRDALEVHMQEQHGERPFRCQICCASYVRSWSLKCHMRTHAAVKPFKCRLCSATFAQPRQLKGHVSMHACVRPFRCGLCPASFSQLTHLKGHKLTHASAMPFKCRHCSLTFALSEDFRAHEMTHVQEN
ncbi:zinc finger protein 14-like isoform X5 [Ornithodoros turicata]|uniref:zinc finger protein 14-like isoform X5 n=1 Tax=Ornithodoros turicata TaxID=34597 RepID=UPI003138F842